MDFGLGTNIKNDLNTEKQYFKTFCQNLKISSVQEQLEYLIPENFRCCHNSSDLFEEHLERINLFKDEYEGGKMNISDEHYRKELWLNFNQIKKDVKNNENNEIFSIIFNKYIESLNKELIYGILRKKELKDMLLERATLLFEMGNYQDAYKGYENAVQSGLLNKKKDWIKFIREYTTLLYLNDQKSKALSILEKKLENRSLLTDHEAHKLSKHLRSIKYDEISKNYDKFQIKEASIQNKLYLNEGVQLIRKITNQKMCLNSVKCIPKDVQILKESPVVFIVRKQGRKIYCCECLKKCENSFIPCSGCAEVIFCSPKCKQNTQWHKYECGFVEWIEDCFSVYALQVYRVLSILGIQEFLSDTCEDYSVYIYDMRRPNDEQSLKERVRTWFCAQKYLRERIRSFAPERIQNYIGSAMGILLIYYKNNPDDVHLKRNGFIKLLTILAEEIVRTEVFNYLWSYKNDKKEKIPLANYQVMISQNLSPSCLPNALWDFDGTSFSLITTRQINDGDEITISYGALKGEQFFKRQAHNVKFCSFCNCEQCLKDVKLNFSLKCNSCNGPIPHNGKQFQNFLCMFCNKKSKYETDYLVKLQQIYLLLPKLNYFLIDFHTNYSFTILFDLNNLLLELIDNLYLNDANLQKTVLYFCKLLIKNKLSNIAIQLCYHFYTNGIDITDNGLRIQLPSFDGKLQKINDQIVQDQTN